MAETFLRLQAAEAIVVEDVWLVSSEGGHATLTFFS
jgi:hypothetical protein